ncbi:purine nucleotide binding protein [Pholiota molesta]|nr:purine nucleotide binding protein [Pholiota molesta]
MAPSTKGSKPAKGVKPGGGLHMFFGPGGSQPKAIAKVSGSSQPSTLGSQKTQPIAFSQKGADVMVIDDTRTDKTQINRTSAAISSDGEMSKPAKVAPITLKRKKSTVISSSDEEKDEDYDMESSESEDADNDDNFIVDDDEEDVKPKKKRPPPKKAPAASSANAEKAKPAKASSSKEKIEDTKAEVKEPAKPKFNWAAKKAALAAGPVAHGSKEVPDGAPDALAGLSFVFTGELSSFSREEAIDLAKRFGGRVVGQPSSKTDWVVLGTTRKHGIRTLNEDEFLNLIGTRKGPGNGNIDEKTKKKMEKEQEEIRRLPKRWRRGKRGRGASGETYDPSTQLWTVRYAPQNIKDICGNKGQVEKLQQWLHDCRLQKTGKHGMNIFRAVLITGSPGIGKTTKSGMNINNTSLDGYIKGPHETNSQGVMITDRSCLIMDEVDGMSRRLNAMIKKTKIPIICIANDRNSQKLKPLAATTFNMPFHKPPAQSIRSRILTIAFKEKMKVPANVIDQLINGAQSDIRQLSHNTMDFDEGKDLEPETSILTPFDITSKMLGPYLYSSTSRETLGDKMEYYFQITLLNYDGPEKALKELRLMDQAASSISDGDIVDAMIHGPEQHWALMPLHAITSTVKPTSLMYGNGAGYGGPNAMSFPQWLGQNSKQNKLNRQLGDIKFACAYIPAMYPHIVRPLQEEGVSAVPEVIQKMDDYYLTKEDWDTIVELGVDEKKDDLVLKKISTATKTALTRKYNSTEHPIPFHKAEDLGKMAKRLPGGPAPDLEEAYVSILFGIFARDSNSNTTQVDDIVEELSDDDSNKDAEDVTKDKLIKEAKKRKAPAAKAAKK